MHVTIPDEQSLTADSLLWWKLEKVLPDMLSYWWTFLCCPDHRMRHDLHVADPSYFLWNESYKHFLSITSHLILMPWYTRALLCVCLVPVSDPFGTGYGPIFNTVLRKFSSPSAHRRAFHLCLAASAAPSTYAFHPHLAASAFNLRLPPAPCRQRRAFSVRPAATAAPSACALPPPSALHRLRLQVAGRSSAIWLVQIKDQVHATRPPASAPPIMRPALRLCLDCFYTFTFTPGFEPFDPSGPGRCPVFKAVLRKFWGEQSPMGDTF